VRRSIMMLFLMLWVSPVFAQQSICGGEPQGVPASVQDKLKGDVEGKAQGLVRIIGDVQLKGAVETSRDELYQRYKDVDKYQINRYFAWVSCQNIMTDTRLTSAQKNEQWLIVYRTLMRPDNSQNMPAQRPTPTETATAIWVDTYTQGDWGGRDRGCSVGPTPRADRCSAAFLRQVAVCWTNRLTGWPAEECRGASAWCTYKYVELNTPQNGTAPGEIYHCRGN
jgi:hypothetical protein